MRGTGSNYLIEVEQLFSSGRLKTYSKNQLIHYEGDPLSHLYLIQSGYVKAYTILDSGDTRTLLLLGPGDIFPLTFSTSLNWEDYQIKYFYQSLTDTEFQALPSSVLQEQIIEHPEKMKAYADYVSASNQAIMHQLEVMKNKKAIDKVELLLPYLVSKAGKEVKPGLYQLEIKLSHQEIADLSGVTRETTTTLLKRLEKSGIIDQKRGHWTVNTNKLPAPSFAV